MAGRIVNSFHNIFVSTVRYCVVWLARNQTDYSETNTGDIEVIDLFRFSRGMCRSPMSHGSKIELAQAMHRLYYDFSSKIV